MKSSPPTIWNPERLDVRAFARAAGVLQAQDPLPRFERLRAEAMVGADGASDVIWRCEGEMRSDGRGGDVPWLHLEATASIPQPCQRCLGPVSIALEVDRWFRFVADEATAEQEDDDSEEDVLSLEPRPSLLNILEDELLMALPLVPMHEECPVAVPMQVGDMGSAGEAPAEREHPFAQLARLKK